MGYNQSRLWGTLGIFDFEIFHVAFSALLFTLKNLWVVYYYYWLRHYLNSLYWTSDVGDCSAFFCLLLHERVLYFTPVQALFSSQKSFPTKFRSLIDRSTSLGDLSRLIYVVMETFYMLAKGGIENKADVESCKED